MNKKGYMLIELIVAMVIMSIIISIAITSLPGLIMKTKVLNDDSGTQKIIDYINISKEIRNAKLKSNFGKKIINLKIGDGIIKYINKDDGLYRVDGELSIKTYFDKFTIYQCSPARRTKCAKWKKRINPSNFQTYHWWQINLTKGDDILKFIVKGK